MTQDRGKQEISEPQDQAGSWTNGRSRAGAIHHSILFQDPQAYSEIANATEPVCFRDLHLDQVTATVIAGRELYSLAPYFYVPLRSAAEVNYRQLVMAELEGHNALPIFQHFADGLQTVRSRIEFAQKAYHKLERARWFADAADLYCKTIIGFAEKLATVSLKSEGLQGLRSFIEDLMAGEDFQRLMTHSRSLLKSLQLITYEVRISGRRIAVTEADTVPDYAAQLKSDFSAFNQGPEISQFDSREDPHLNHVEEAILDLVARLHPDAFVALEDFYQTWHLSLIDPDIGLFEREVQFCLAWRAYTERLRASGLGFSYPRMATHSEAAFATEIFDLALADVLVGRSQQVITNSFQLRQNERTIVVSGPNQGGKTTFARTIGQIHHLARIGCSVPGKEVRIPLCDAIFTIFEKQENVRAQAGKLEEELLRIHKALQGASSNSLVIMNESLSSTSSNDAVTIGRRLMEQVDRIGLLCVLVTFLDELSAFSSSTVSMVAEVDLYDPSKRTFRLVRRPADGRAYAMAIAEKYRLRSETIQSRIAGRPA